MTGRRPVTFALLALLVAPLLLGVGPAPAAASSPPEATPFCERSLARSLAYSLPNATVESTTAHATVVNDTAADWRVNATFRNRSTVTRLRGDESLRRRVVADASGTVSPANVTVAAAGPRTLAFRFRTDDFAARTPGGLLRVDYFHVRGSEFRTLSCDRLTLVGPPETTLSNRPTETRTTVRATGNRVVVTDTADYRPASFFVFAPDGTPPLLRDGLTAVALALAVSGTVAGNLAFMVCLPTAVLAAGFVSVHRLFGSLPRSGLRARARELGLTVLGLVVVGVVPTALLLFFDQSALLVAVPGLAVAGAAVVVGPWTHSSRASLVPVVAGVAAAGVAAGVGTLLGLLALRTGVATTLALAAVFAGYPLGVAASSGRPARRPTGLAALAFGLAAATYLPLTVAGGSLYAVAVVFVALVAFGLVVAAVPFALVGVGSVER